MLGAESIHSSLQLLGGRQQLPVLRQLLLLETMLLAGSAFVIFSLVALLQLFGKVS